MTELDGEDGISSVIWIRLILTVAVSFWCQAIVTEERLVPALNVIAERYKISDDIAGATLMAAGASSPELFSSFVALFITHSAMGLGTIVGSEIFNQLVICAGAVYASKSGSLRLDRKIVFREVGFYGLSILLLYMALQDVREVPINNEISDAEEGGLELEDRIFISFGGAFLIFSAYIGYVLVCANMKAVVSLFENLPFPSRSHATYKSLPQEAELNPEDANHLSDTDKEKMSEEACDDFDEDQFEMIATKCSDLSETFPTAPDADLEEIVDHEGMTTHRRHPHSIVDGHAMLPNPTHMDQHQHHEEGSLIAFPSQAPEWQVMFHILLLPLRYAIHYTVPDVRISQREGGNGAQVFSETSRAYLATFQCLVWLILSSYTMVSSLERLATLMNVPDSVVGVTISAAGTSLPNYIASKIAAEKGLGNQAVSNAFGSNTFNILVGLGLPWTLYTSFVTGFEPYSDLRNDDIVESIAILAIVLLVFVVLMAMSDYVLYRWHGNLFVAMYVGYLGLVVYQNWDWDFRIEEADAEATVSGST